MCPAIHINSRSWLRSSSTHEPSDPPLRVIFWYVSTVSTGQRIGRIVGSGVGLASPRFSFATVRGLKKKERKKMSGAVARGERRSSLGREDGRGASPLGWELDSGAGVQALAKGLRATL
jgi:hypothetical protein